MKYKNLNTADKQRFKKNCVKGFFENMLKTIVVISIIGIIGFATYFVATLEFGFLIVIAAAAIGFWSYSAYKNAKDIQRYLDTWRKALEDDMLSRDNFETLYELLRERDPAKCKANNVKHYLHLDEEEREAEMFRLRSRIKYYEDRIETDRAYLAKYQ